MKLIKSLFDELRFHWPQTPRELIQKVFLLCVCAEAIAALLELWWDKLHLALTYLGAAYGTTILFSVVYLLFASMTDGECTPDSGRSQPMARTCLRVMHLVCVGIMAGVTAWCFARGQPFYFIFPLVGIVVSIFVFGVMIRLFESKLTIDQDKGLLPAGKQ